jgi:hypothetical protein
MLGLTAQHLTLPFSVQITPETDDCALTGSGDMSAAMAENVSMMVRAIVFGRARPSSKSTNER